MPLASDPISAAVDALVSFLQAQIPGLTILTEWPYANQQLQYPSLTITTGKVDSVPLNPPEQIAVTTPDINNQVVATEVISELDATFQLDLWTRTKLERRTVLGQIQSAFSAQQMDTSGNNNPQGISLRMGNYFNAWVRYDLVTSEFRDDEQAAERQERRARMSVLVNCREIRQRTYYAMRTIQVTVNSAISKPDFDDPNQGEVFVI